MRIASELDQNKPTAGLWWTPSRRAIVLCISIFPITPRVIETFEVGCRKRPYLRDAERGGPHHTQGDIEVRLHISCSCLFVTSLFLHRGERLMVLFPCWLVLLYLEKGKRNGGCLYESTVRVKLSVHLHQRFDSDYHSMWTQNQHMLEDGSLAAIKLALMSLSAGLWAKVPILGWWESMSKMFEMASHIKKGRLYYSQKPRPSTNHIMS